MNYYKNDIRHVRGDTLSHPIFVENLQQDLESIYFTCRDGANDNSEILFEKSLNNGITYMYYDEETDTRTYLVRIAPSDTKDLQSGTYYYDEQIAVNGDVITIMKGRFIIEQDITRKSTIPEDPEAYIKEYLDIINGEVI
jgi:hypothetical protein